MKKILFFLIWIIASIANAKEYYFKEPNTGWDMACNCLVDNSGVEHCTCTDRTKYSLDEKLQWNCRQSELKGDKAQTEEYRKTCEKYGIKI
jgi:hypothetical protein